MLYGQQGREKNEALWLSKHREIIDMYQPDIIWQDFNLHRISRPVLLEFLAYYYNQAVGWGRQVVATYKDGLNTQCAVLDYERGGPTDITENYWLTDDAISSSSWCYTEGIGYYSNKQILHGFLDRISKNGNLLLNISPKADGSIPKEQKDILLSIGAWLKKYGEAVYATRAWEKYGEGPTRMGAAHGVMGSPSVGTARDIRYTRSKDNTTLYAILLGWEKGQKDIILRLLSSDRIDGRHLTSIEMIDGRAGSYLPLTFRQQAEGLIVHLPERPVEELAYVLKLHFKNGIPPLDRYVDLDCDAHYYIAPADSRGNWVLGADLTLADKTKEPVNQWKMDRVGKGIYTILSREDTRLALGYNSSSQTIELALYDSKDSQQWKIDEAIGGSFTISNNRYPGIQLSLESFAAEGIRAGVSKTETDAFSKWKFVEVCELKQQAFKVNTIPGTIQAEDFDTGCPGEAFYDSDDINEGAQYRLDEGVDIERCSAGGFNVGWTRAGEWIAYTVTVDKSTTYRISFYVASTYDSSKLHLERDGEDITGVISIPNTGGFQNWQIVTRTVDLDAGEHVLRLVIDDDHVNVDKIGFDEIK